MQKIKAAVCHAFGEPLKIEDIAIRQPLSGEVEVTVKACAVCHSDISYMDGGWGGDLPAVYGHEAAGVISKTGPGVKGYAEGDAVLVTLIRHCGNCPSCVAAHPSLCSTAPQLAEAPVQMPDGSSLTQAMSVGGFAEKVIVDQTQIAALPKEIDMAAASLLSCGVITGVGSVVNTAAVRPGQTVVVIGVGGVGLNAIQGARIAGAARIVAVDLIEEKLDIAREFGATDGINAGSEKPWNELRNITNGRMADAVFVAVGAIPAFETAGRYLAWNGNMYIVGMPHSGEKAEYEPVIYGSMGLGMKGTKMGNTVLARDIPWLLDLYQQGRLKLDELVSGRWSLDEINEAIQDTRSGKARRNVILF